MDTFGMKYAVDPRLENALGHFYVIRVPEHTETTIQHLAPSLEMMVVFNFGPPVRFSFADKEMGPQQIFQTSVVGPLQQMMNYELIPGTDLLILPFILDGYYRVSINSCLADLWHLLAALPTTEGRLQVLTEHLVSTITDTDAASLPLLQGIPDLHHTTINPVKSIAVKAAITERSVQQRFKKYTGYSPKALLRFLRFKQVLQEVTGWKKTEKKSWFALITKYGYHDQSHLIKDFKYYTGVSPKRFLKLHWESVFCINRE
ncbi:AraC-like DNA-binding protein [Pedobacter sp. CAN_A7]|uniref:helix-turn-helix domain-containing protein n=1 Tax=Pedobacter sp. CAN_A7 TaxID=2787722 RepID=UPI0018CA0C33